MGIIPLGAIMTHQVLLWSLTPPSRDLPLPIFLFIFLSLGIQGSDAKISLGQSALPLGPGQVSSQRVVWESLCSEYCDSNEEFSKNDGQSPLPLCQIRGGGCHLQDVVGFPPSAGSVCHSRAVLCRLNRGHCFWPVKL